MLLSLNSIAIEVDNFYSPTHLSILRDAKAVLYVIIILIANFLKSSVTLSLKQIVVLSASYFWNGQNYRVARGCAVVACHVMRNFHPSFSL